MDIQKKRIETKKEKNFIIEIVYNKKKDKYKSKFSIIVRNQ